ncbi:conserved Plasmodium protein, unknown function [Plasmodium gallinaceum]|uniref:Uncharacterized protein n=1 Tax=Plasmodium gallinaceum TaxID=5849 RepID=A0A1J1GLB5_PLAGA|nr:conserved Plasmodium protein, unknown function [Plasmodium gallinaceum]CRG93115.1 conserved Plasmodium protein, unknown function [Plasmodium gallinaceum]
MNYPLKKKYLLNNYLPENILIRNFSKLKCKLFCNFSLNNYGYLKKDKLNKFKNIYYRKKGEMHIAYSKNYKWSKESNKKKKEYCEDQTSKKFLYYPESTSFPYGTICIVLGMVGVSTFLKILIYNLRNCDTEENILLQIDKILDYLDNYFIIYNSESNKKNINKSDIFDIKYLTSQFFTNENILQCSVQLSTFFLASRFLEKQYGSIRFLALFLTGSLLSILVSFYFFKYIKKVESLNFIDFVLIHPSGSMAFICALCSLCFKNSSIWKNIPVHCSILIVPYLFSSFYGLLSLYKIKKYNFIEESKENDANINENILLQNKDTILENKSEKNSPSNKVINITDDNVIKQKNDMNNKNKENYYNSNLIQKNENKVLNILKNFLIINACDSIIQKGKKENMFSNKRIINLKKEALKNINEINNKSQKIFFGLSSSFTDIFGIILASTTFLFLKFLK